MRAFNIGKQQHASLINKIIDNEFGQGLSFLIIKRKQIWPDQHLFMQIVIRHVVQSYIPIPGLSTPPSNKKYLKPVFTHISNSIKGLS
jgi:hypothetical protein